MLGFDLSNFFVGEMKTSLFASLALVYNEFL